ncbi:MAG: arsenate reductase family protein [Alphaproteobacteria bacterium]|nr:arsenate reductase family protein [Alphaproteobacteria bacterium]MBU2084961.1 arsenate reductase family protein [Alphaproteobacteria bacterium]MBU2143961.1 arsenate reductase family protein [Alphaproteobacteria bacterium]MBU2198076.1 arsenate reductase family protein [Alphaproteobacteria bacterium]
MTYTYLHNPGCSTSRKGLELLESKGITLDVRKYMNASEQLSVDELKDIAVKMGGVSPRAFLRESNAKDAGVSPEAPDADLFAAMAANPKLIQRPILIKGDKAVLGRPVETMLDLL